LVARENYQTVTESTAEDYFEINFDAFAFDGLVGEFFFAVFGGNELLVKGSEADVADYRK
jgi:hypothetical protein